MSFGPDGHSAEYISSAKQVRLIAEAGDRFSQAARVMIFRLVDNCWMENDTLRFQCTLTNKAASALTPVADPLCMFIAIRVFVGCQLCEDFQELPPLASMMNRFKPVWRQIQDIMEIITSRRLTALGWL